MPTIYADLENRNGTIFNKKTGAGYQNPTQLAVDMGINADKINWNNIAEAGTLEKTLPPENKPIIPGEKTLPAGEAPAEPKADSFAALTIALREASRIALRRGTKSGLTSTFGGMKSAVPGFAPEKVSGETVKNIIDFVEGQVGPTVQSEFTTMKDIVDGIQRNQEKLELSSEKLKGEAKDQITQAISSGMWNKMDYNQKKTIWQAAGYTGEPLQSEGDYSSQIVIDENGMGTNIIIDKTTGQVVKKESVGKVGSAREPSDKNKVTKEEATRDMANMLDTVMGSDKYIAPDKYLEAKQAWVKESGFTGKEFDDSFSVYRNPTNRYYPVEDPSLFK